MTVPRTEGGRQMSRNALLWLWGLVAALAVATVVVGTIAGYRADEASVIEGGETALAVPQWGAALWLLAGATILAGLAAMAVTLGRVRGTRERPLVAPAAVMVLGLAGAVVFLPAALISVGGLAWLVVRAVGSPGERVAA